MKKFASILLVFMLVIPLLVSPLEVNGKTIKELQEELEKTKEELKQNEENKNLTQEQMNTINQNINSIRTKITNIEKELIDLQEEIENLNEEIEKKDQQIKDIMNFVQISSGESVYLEYAFGAQSFTDFIYRFAVAEQLANYNARLIDEYNQLIEENENKKKEQEEMKKKMQQEQEALAEELQKLKRDMVELEDASVSLEDEIKAQEEMLQMYLDKGCKENDDIDTCGQSLLPPTTAFYRPLISGYVTSEFGYRCLTLNGVYSCGGHSGIDFSTSERNAKVYAVGTGMVATIYRYNSCGGNMVFIHHRLKTGETYTSAYYHLRTVNVSVGDVVTKDTVIGIMGGDPSIETWDKCSTAAHSHLTLAYGLYGSGQDSWSAFISRTFNPRLMINAPTTHYSWFTDRFTKYN